MTEIKHEFQLPVALAIFSDDDVITSVTLCVYVCMRVLFVCCGTNKTLRVQVTTNSSAVVEQSGAVVETGSTTEYSTRYMPLNPPETQIWRPCDAFEFPVAVLQLNIGNRFMMAFKGAADKLCAAGPDDDLIQSNNDPNELYMGTLKHVVKILYEAIDEFHQQINIRTGQRELGCTLTIGYLDRFWPKYKKVIDE